MAKPLKIKFGKPHSVVYFAKDLRAIRDWYCKVLGTLPYRDDKNFLGFRLRGANLCFHRADKKSGTNNAAQIIYWTVKDISVTATILLSYGALWYRRPIAIIEGGKICQLRDPFGNIIGLAEKGE